MSQTTATAEPYLNSNLFSGHYLDERIQQRDEWDCDESAREAMETLQSLYEMERGLVEGYSEDPLIDNWIDEVLDILGFGTNVETTLPGGGGFVDVLLFENTDARRDAASVYLDTKDTTDLFEGGLGLVEAKQWDADFSHRFSEQRPYRNASHQIKHYLERTPENIQWGILTNGRKWRLYGTKDYETQTYYEIDLPELLEQGDLEAFKYFYLLFRPAAFRESAGTTFLETVWSESETAAQELGEDLQDNVFTALRVLGHGFVETNDLSIDPNDQERLNELKDQSLVFLYRLMFVLYAEARELIHPEGQAAVNEYEENFSLNALRLEVHDEIGVIDKGFSDEFSEYSTTMWSRVEDLFRLIDEGEESLGIPPYNGGLFDREEHTFLTKNEVSNRYLAEVIYRLSTTENGDGRYVLADYADLDTRHLGSVYEGLLEHQFRIAPEQYAAIAEDDGQVWKPATEVTVADAVETVPENGLYVVNDEGERKATGAYYTPDYVVTYIVEETVEPLVEEIREGLLKQGFESGTQEYLGPFLRGVTNLKILDPAMGSGHFLTKATGYLTEEVMGEVRDVEDEMGVAFDEQHVRREIAKECIYGVDLNGMAVELAKLSMWLETLAADRPLAFLDHHLKTGNSLIGSDVTQVLSNDIGENTGQLTLQQSFTRIREQTLDYVMDLMQELLDIDNETLEDVKSMEEIYNEIRDDQFYQRLFELTNVHTAEQFGLDVPKDAYETMAAAIEDADEWSEVKKEDWVQTAQAMSSEEAFFHWELEYPDVFFDENGEKQENAGFDAVIGNPPYVSNWELTASDENLPDLLENLYPEATGGHWDLFIPFSYRAAKLTRDSGFHSFVTPSSLATEKYGKNLREIYIRDYNLLKLVSFGDHQVFEGVDRQCLIYIISPGNVIDGADCEIFAYEPDQFVYQYTIDPQRFLSYSNSTFRIEVTKQDMSIKTKIESESILLGELCCVNPGVVAHSGTHSDLDFKKDDVISKEDGESKRKYVSGGNISRHNIRWEGEYMDYYTYQEHFHRPKFPALFENPKIMFSRISGANNKIKSCYDSDGYYTNHIVIHAVPWDDDIKEHQSGVDYEIDPDSHKYNPQYISGIVNSKLINYYFDCFLATGTLQGSYSEMNPEDIRKLPIKAIEFDCGPETLKKEYNAITISDEKPLLENAISIPEENEECSISQLAQEAISDLVEEMQNHHEDLNSLSLNLLDYLGNYEESAQLSGAGLFQPPKTVSTDSILYSTATDYEKLRIGTVELERPDERTIVVNATARYKPEDEDNYQTDRWGYTETNLIEAFRLIQLDELEADLIESFVPVAVEEAGGFANFRETATKTNSLVDRLKALTLPDPDDVAEDLERYLDAKARAEELDEKIEKTDDLIDEIVYELYGLTDEEIEIVEASIKS